MRYVTLAVAVFALSIYAGGFRMSAQSDATTAESRNKAIVEAGFKAWSNGTGSPYDLLADNARWTIVGRSVASKTYEGREAFMRDVIRPFNARMREPLKPAIRRIYADGDTVIVFFDARSTARDGKPYVNTTPPINNEESPSGERPLLKRAVNSREPVSNYFPVAFVTV